MAVRGLFVLARRVLAVLVAGLLAAVVAPVQTLAHADGPVTQVIVWGDSMTQVWPRYLQELLGIPVLPKGVGGDTIQETQTLFNEWVLTNPAQVATTAHLCWCGHVNTNRQNQNSDTNSDTIVPALQAMAAQVPAGQFMPIGLTNGPDQPIGSAGYNLVVLGVNVDMAKKFGKSYAEVRRFLVTDGLRVAGIARTPTDQANMDDDIPPASLRVAPGGGNPAHLNDAGRRVTASRLDDLVRAAGWLGSPPATAVNIGDASGNEGDGGSSMFTFAVSLTTASDTDVSVRYATVDGTADAGVDYAPTSGTLVIRAGTFAASVAVQVFGDLSPESDETFQVVLSAPVGAEVDDGIGLGVIFNDEESALLPTVTAVSPSSIGQAAAGRQLTITGTGFTDSSVVSFSGTGFGVTQTTFVDSSTLVATVGTAQTTRVGVRDVLVTNLGVGSGTCTGCLTVTARPVPKTVTPSSAAQATTTAVTLTGTGFQPVRLCC
ncbi:MAG: IPT/TIG domain-containing protein [Actinomycetota bacterium]|nr:IPT/TIG domain-containing protein [Actinomycetota bacterium]